MGTDWLDRLYTRCWTRQEGRRLVSALSTDLSFAGALLWKGWFDLQIAEALLERSPAVVWRHDGWRYALKVVRLARMRLAKMAARPRRVGTKADGSNPRALGVNSKALGTNPRALGLSPKQLGISPTQLGINPLALGVSPKQLRRRG